MIHAFQRWQLHVFLVATFLPHALPWCTWLLNLASPTLPKYHNK